MKKRLALAPSWIRDLLERTVTATGNSQRRRRNQLLARLAIEARTPDDH